MKLLAILSITLIATPFSWGANENNDEDTIIFTQPGANPPSITGFQSLHQAMAKIEKVRVKPVFLKNQDLFLDIIVTIAHVVAYEATGADKVGALVPMLAYHPTAYPGAVRQDGIVPGHKVTWFSNPFFDLLYGQEKRFGNRWKWKELEHHELTLSARVINGLANMETMQKPRQDGKLYEYVIDIEGYPRLIVYNFKVVNGQLVDHVEERLRPQHQE